MRFQKRDGEILKVIYNNDGVMAKRHLKRIFWQDKSWRAMEVRLSKLYSANYISWSNVKQRKIYPIPEPICWLGWKGALFIAGKCGVEVSPPTTMNENQMRVLQKKLRMHGIHWVREPRWSLLAHDISITNFRFAVQAGISQYPFLTLENWITESVFRSNPDKVSYEIKGRNGYSQWLKKGICPDAYFEVVDERRRMRGEPCKVRFLLELDMSTHDNPSFAMEKAVPGVAYIRSSAYKERFGNNTGRWLIVTNGNERRLRNLMDHTHKLIGPDIKLFFFTSLRSLVSNNALVSPIWCQTDINESTSLLTI